jgi:hypothetical protein
MMTLLFTVRPSHLHQKNSLPRLAQEPTIPFQSAAKTKQMTPPGPSASTADRSRFSFSRPAFPAPPLPGMSMTYSADSSTAPITHRSSSSPSRSRWRAHAPSSTRKSDPVWNISYGFVILALLPCLPSELKSLLIPWLLDNGDIAQLCCTVKFLLYSFSNACSSASQFFIIVFTTSTGTIFWSTLYFFMLSR